MTHDTFPSIKTFSSSPIFIFKMRRLSTFFRFGRFLSILALAMNASLAQDSKVPYSAPEPTRTPQQAKLNRVSKIPNKGETVEIKVSATPADEDLKTYLGMIEPLLPVSDTSSPAERADLAAALSSWSNRKIPDDVSALERFVKSNPRSPWTPSVRLNLGHYNYKAGRFSKAMGEWEAAWKLVESNKSVSAGIIANSAVAEFAVMLSRIGRKDELAALLRSTSDRQFRGGALNQIDRAREGLWNMEHRPGISFLCGPSALNAIQSEKQGGSVPGFMKRMISPTQGFSLKELKNISKTEMDQSMQVAKRSPGAALIIPSVVHWNVGHYGALMREQDGSILLKDPTFGNDTWMTKGAVDEESSGYFLVPSGPLPAGWNPVSDEDAAKIYGKGHSGDTDPNETDECSHKSGKPCPNTHMAGYSFHTLLASLNITDIPVGYKAAVGPDVDCEVTYNMREAGQPTTDIQYTNFSPQWEFQWVSYLDDNTLMSAADVTIQLRGGGAEVNTGYTTSNPVGTDPTSVAGTFARNRRWGAILVRLVNGTYERRFEDGSKEVFAQIIGTNGNRRVFLTQVVDPHGNAVTLEYDRDLGFPTRLKRIIDATGLVTKFYYEVTENPGQGPPYFLVSKIEDPFGRTAKFEYQPSISGRHLKTITDTIGITSTFGLDYLQQITSLTTPYGTTSFAFGSPNTPYGLIRWIEATDPQGDKERLEYQLSSGTTGVANLVNPAEVPIIPGVSFATYDMDDRNTFYWSKKAWASAPGDYSKAHLCHWLQMDGIDRAIGVLESEKEAFENRVWYRYPGQPVTDSMNIGTSSRASTIARRIEDGNGGFATEVTSRSYNSLGNLTQSIDPLGREQQVVYDSNGIDPLFVKQKVGAALQTVQSFTYDTAPHAPGLPLTITDAAGQVTTLTYNSAGQIKTITNAKSETTTLEYGTSTVPGALDPLGRLISVKGPVVGAEVSVEYDAFHRPKKVTDSSLHVTLYDYDVFDRVTLITYPDATTEQFEYDRLDLFAQKDRQNRWTRTWHNALRQPVLTADALGRTLKMQWCKCGALAKLTDGKNQVTSWTHDAQSRLTGKTYPDNRTEAITYEPLSGRVSTTTDAAGQIKTSKYYLDGALKNLSYSNLAPGTAATAGVSYTYDPDFPRPATITDGTGTTSLDYYPASLPGAPVLGALMLKTVDGPLTGLTDLITYTYDALGRQKTTNIGPGSSDNLVTRNFDSLGRIQSIVNPLGTFNHFYVGDTATAPTLPAPTNRTDHIDYPNGQKTTFGYFPNLGDNRLQTITNTSNGTSVLSQFDYTYLPDGNIKTWQRQLGSDPATKFTLGYDPVDQLTSATLALATAPGTVAERYSYQYDLAGNRTSSQKSDLINTATVNSANQITGLTGGGKLLVSGTTNEPAKVKVNGQPATTTPPPENLYQAWASVVPGSNTLTVEATDYAAPPNTTTKSWTVNVTGSPARSFSYDGNGNTTSDGLRTYQWDAEKRLVKITQGTNSYEFIYDGMFRRVAEKLNGTITKRWVWNGTQIAEQRDTSGSAVQRQYYGEGEKRNGSDAGNYYYTRDHLGSIREMTDSTAKVRARYDYDPYGMRTNLTTGILAGDRLDCDFGFTGHYYHVGSNLHLTLFRVYDQDIGRWLSTDPIYESGGLNLYVYVGGDVVNNFDPLGLWTLGGGLSFQGGILGGLGLSGGFYMGHDSDCGIFSGWSSGFLGSGELTIQSPTAGIGVFGHGSNADTVDQLIGSGWVVGGSGGEGVTGGIEISGGLNQDSRGFPTESNGIYGGQLNLGFGGNLPAPAEVHGGLSETIGKTWGAKSGGCPPK